MKITVKEELAGLIAAKKLITDRIKYLKDFDTQVQTMDSPASNPHHCAHGYFWSEVDQQCILDVG